MRFFLRLRMAKFQEVIYIELLLFDLSALRGWALMLLSIILKLPDFLVSDGLRVQRHLS